MQSRIEASKPRSDKRQGAITRRQRTRHLIKLGGLVQKAGLTQLTNDDRAVLLGIFIQAASVLRGEEGQQAAAIWRRRGKKAFEDED